MSTRCHIGVYDEKAKLDDFEVLLYRHSDGYPSGVLPDIMPFLAWWDKGRGVDDAEYTGARLLQWLCNSSDGWKREQWDNKDFNAEMEYTGVYGHGICKIFHGDIEYFYRVDKKGVTVYDVRFDFEGEEKMEDKCKKIGFIPFVDFENNADYKKLTKE